MNLYEILGIIIIHWFADFVCQTDKMAQGKSKKWKWLLKHTYYYSMIWLMAGIGLSGWIGIQGVLQFAVITFVVHTITDYFTSRLNSKLWEEKKIHYFFVSVGFDQILHYAQLFITYQLLFK